MGQLALSHSLHQQLMLTTASLPCRTIYAGNQPYLQRYLQHTDKNGGQVWLHRFLTADSEPHHHSHPWTATTSVLCGGYCEEILTLGPQGERTTRLHWLNAGSTNELTPDKIHRITSAIPDTWTCVAVQPGRLANWFFITETGQKTHINTSPADWWATCTTRDGKPFDRRAILR